MNGIKLICKGADFSDNAILTEYAEITLAANQSLDILKKDGTKYGESLVTGDAEQTFTINIHDVNSDNSVSNLLAKTASYNTGNVHIKKLKLVGDISDLSNFAVRVYAGRNSLIIDEIDLSGVCSGYTGSMASTFSYIRSSKITLPPNSRPSTLQYFLNGINQDIATNCIVDFNGIDTSEVSDITGLGAFAHLDADFSEWTLDNCTFASLAFYGAFNTSYPDGLDLHSCRAIITDANMLFRGDGTNSVTSLDIRNLKLANNVSGNYICVNKALTNINLSGSASTDFTATKIMEIIAANASTMTQTLTLVCSDVTKTWNGSSWS